MKKYAKLVCLLGSTLLLVNSASALAPAVKPSGVKPDNKPAGPHTGNQKSASCSPASARYIMDFNDVSALLEMGGVLFQDRNNSIGAYEVPKGGGARAIYAAALWMGGTDEFDQLKIAAVRFRNEGNDFWGGPLAQLNLGDPYNPGVEQGDGVIRPHGDPRIDPEVCAAYDKFFPMKKATVVKFQSWWKTCNPASSEFDAAACGEIDEESLPSNEELVAINEWPAHGDLSRAEDQYLAPFYDRSKDGMYDPADGDCPWYDDVLEDEVACGTDRRVTLYGDQTVWWVFNDKGNIHTESQGEPIGMEIRAQAFAFATSDEINRMTFYNYELINRGTQTLKNTFFSQYVDPDIGGGNDDYIGCDVSRGLGYAYNANAFDDTDGEQIGYGSNPPAIGVDFFEGPYQDADFVDNPGPYKDTVTGQWVIPDVNTAIDEDGIVYPGIGTGYSDGVIDNERFGMRRFTYFTRTAVFPYTDPEKPHEYYNYMKGQWANGSEMYYGGAGYVGSNGVTNVLSDYMFPGDSDPLGWATDGQVMAPWTEVSAGTEAGDRRFVQSAGPFTLKPGAMNNITVGIVYGRSAEGGLMASVDAMKVADTKAQLLFDACFRILDPPNAPKLNIQELENELILTLSNPGTSNNANESYEMEDKINIPEDADDRFYRFEGYQIFQLLNEAASVADIGDNSKARLVAQCDLKNDVTNLINYERDEATQIIIGREMVNGENEGIRHSFRVTEDAFAIGANKVLVNHRTYYYVAVAYAHNEFKKYVQDDPTALDGQKKPYIVSRLSFDGTSVQSVSAVPHNPMPEADGTYHFVEYGSTPKITRLDGVGNGNRNLRLTPASVDFILANGTMNDPEYEYGSGPIQVKVVDPLAVADGYYELSFKDYSTGAGNAADTASWVINRYTSKNGEFLSSISSERAISSDNEQVIPEWGISVQLYQHKYVNSGIAGNITTRVTDPIGASISFADSSKRWLSFIRDNDLYEPHNWIRSGTYQPDTETDCTPDLPDYYNPCFYRDEISQDDDEAYEQLLYGGVAPHRLTGYQGDFMPLAYSPNLTAISTPRSNASISYLPSVDIVITSDPSKWTRCPVIELGRDANLNLGGAQPGEMRKSLSVNKNGQSDGSGETGMGWFPGYAIDLETGTRLHLAFGENSYLAADGGADMIWNPGNREYDPAGNPVMGGVQPIWVFGVWSKRINDYNTLYDMPPYNPQDESNNYLQQQLQLLEANDPDKNNIARRVYGNLCWIVNPLLSTGYQLNQQTDIPTDVRIHLSVNKEYKNLVTTNKNGGRPMYSWSMDDITTKTGSRDALSEALQMINVVPNPYLAFSEYEKSRLDTRVKITNLPEKCKVNIYASNGKMVRSFKKDSPVTSIDWDLNNHQRIPVASGVYLIHVEVPDVGERVLKAFIGMRQVDLQGL